MRAVEIDEAHIVVECPELFPFTTVKYRDL